MTDLTLFCLVDGEPTSRAFPLSTPPSQTIGGLKDLLKIKKTVQFKDVDADQLTVWQVSIPVTEDEVPIVLDLLNEKKKLGPTTRLSKLFVDVLPEDTIHIIVQRPPPAHAPVITHVSSPRPAHLSEESRPSTPLPADLRADLKKITDEFFHPGSTHAKFLEEFVQGSYDLPVTKGSISGLPTVGKRGLAMARTAPSLMFIDLPCPSQSSKEPNQAEKILAKYPGTRHLPLFGVSGCGKTRTAMELLSRSWGLYFNAGARDLGSSDMRTIIQALSDRPETYLSENKAQNTDRVRHLTFGLLYARLSILNHCLNITGSRDTFSCQRWMLLQVATPVFDDVFQALFQTISQYLHDNVVSSSIMDIVQDQFDSVQKHLLGRAPSSSVLPKFLLVLDESQILGRLPPKFLDSDRETVRPILAPILHAFRRTARMLDEDKICVLPCGTGMSSYELKWSGGSASGAKLSKAEYEASKLSGMVVDFAGWTDIGSISTYLERLGQRLDDKAKARLACLVPQEAVMRLFRGLRGRFRPIISTIEDIIEADRPLAWEQCIQDREYRLTTAHIPTTSFEEERLEGNLCGELRRLFKQVDHDRVAFADYRTVESSLKLAMAALMTQGGYLAFKGKLPKLVETAFGRIKIIDGEYHTTIDEPFALRAADNYFQEMDPAYSQHQIELMGRSPNEASRGKEWEYTIPHEMVRIFDDMVVSKRLFHNADPPHDMFRRRASIVGWSGQMRTTGFQEMSMSEFLDAHIKNNSERDGQPVAPFFYPEEQVSGPDIVFVVRFKGSALDTIVDPSLTPSSGPTPTDVLCPVFVQVKLCMELTESKAIDARSTVQPRKIMNHGVNLGQYCQPHGHYISLVVCYPAEISKYFLHKSPMQKHGDDLTEIALTIDDSNIQLFSERHVKELNHMKRLGIEMAEASEAAKRVKL